MNIGSVVRIYSAIAGYDKYHLCLTLPTDGPVARFLMINSDPGYRDLHVVDDGRLPCLPKSPTGKSCFSFSLIVRLTSAQLELYNATVLGEIDYGLACELQSFAQGVRSLSKSDHRAVMDALDEIVARLTPILPA